jgi:TFIIH basal transcription factor complex TTD-A subunit
MKQLLVNLNEQESFIIQDLDETHLLVDPAYIDRLKERFELALEENIYKLSDGTEVKATW